MTEAGTIQYDRRSFLVWDDAGVTAVRNEENAYNISAIYLQVKENKEPVSAIPAPTGIYGGEFIVDGIKWDRASDMTVCSGELEIASSASGGYMEITFAGSRDRRDTWQHYRDIMAENMQAALVERDRVRLMARNHPAGKPSDDQPDNATSLAQSCESFLTHSVNAPPCRLFYGQKRALSENQPAPAFDRGSGKVQRIRFRQVFRSAVRIFRMRASRL